MPPLQAGQHAAATPLLNIAYEFLSQMDVEPDAEDGELAAVAAEMQAMGASVSGWEDEPGLHANCPLSAGPSSAAACSVFTCFCNRFCLLILPFCSRECRCWRC